MDVSMESVSGTYSDSTWNIYPDVVMAAFGGSLARGRHYSYHRRQPDVPAYWIPLFPILMLVTDQDQTDPLTHRHRNYEVAQEQISKSRYNETS